MHPILIRIYLFIALFGVLSFSAQTTLTTKQIDSLLLSNSKPNNWNLKENVSFLNKIFEESERIHYEEGMYKALFRITNWYMQKREYKNAFPYFDKIKNLDIKNPENYKYKAGALQSKATAFVGLGLYDDALKTIDESIVISNKLLNKDAKYRSLGKAYDSKANLTIEMKKSEDSVLFYLQKSAWQYKQIKNNSEREALLNSAYINISISFFEAKKLDSAMFYSYKVLRSDQKVDEQKMAVYQTVGQIHRERKSLDSAFYYYKKAEEVATKLKEPLNLKIIYKTLSEMYSEINDKDSALLYSGKYSHVLDNLSEMSKESAVIANKSIKEELKQENDSKRKVLYWSAGGIVTLLIFISLYLLKNYNREKVARVDEKTIIENKDVELKELKSKVNDAFEEVITLAKNNDSAFLSRFKEVYPDFCDRIQEICPDILNSELTFCAYLKLNFSTKEIANYTFTVAKSVQNRKNRLRKRLNIPSDEDIYIWIGNI